MTRALLLFCLLPAAAPAEHLTILHTSDIHAQFTPTMSGVGGIAHLATAIRQERAKCGPRCLYIDAGDLVQGSPVSTLFKGVPMFEFGNLLGIDIGILGNHEFDYGAEYIARYLDAARFPLLCANVVNAKGELITGKAYTIRNLSGVRVAVIGVLMDQLLNGYATPERVKPWRVLPVVETVRKYVAEVKPKSDLIVLLGHTLDSEDDAILRNFPDVDILVTGHHHAGIQQARVVDGRILVKVMSNTREYGRLDLDLDVPGRKVTAWKWNRIPVDPKRFSAAPDVTALAEQWEKKVAALVDVEIGTSRRDILQPELKALIETAMAAESGADFAFMNRGGVRAPMPKGKILARTIWNIIPFDNKVLIGRFKGSELPPAITSTHEIDPNKTYTLAVSDFTAENQGASGQLGRTGLKFPETAPDLQRDMVINWIKKRKIIE